MLKKDKSLSRYKEFDDYKSKQKDSCHLYG